LENKKNANLVKACESSYFAQYLIVFEQITHCKVFGQASSYRFQKRFFCQIESPVPLKSIKDIPDLGNKSGIWVRYSEIPIKWFPS